MSKPSWGNSQLPAVQGTPSPTVLHSTSKQPTPHHPGPCQAGLSDVPAQKAWRAEVWKDTHHLVDVQKSYVSVDGTEHQLGATIGEIQKAVTGFNGSGPRGSRNGQVKNTVVKVQNIDCVEGAVNLHLTGSNPIVMDAASNGHFGGGYKSGSRAQEEELCRRSALAEVMQPLQKKFYPLTTKGNFGVYCPPIPFFKRGADDDYALMNAPAWMAVGIAAAYNKPDLVGEEGNQRLADNIAKDTREMIRTFFQMALKKGHKSCVAIPLGCGAFQNPAMHVAEMFMQELAGDFKNCFDEVLFAILDDHNAYHKYNPYGNFSAFGMQALRILQGEGDTAAVLPSAKDVEDADEGDEVPLTQEQEDERNNNNSTTAKTSTSTTGGGGQRSTPDQSTTVVVVGPQGENMSFEELVQHAEQMKWQVPTTGNNKHLKFKKKKQ